MKSYSLLLPPDAQVRATMQKLTDSVRNARYQQWVSQSELAEAASVPQSVIARLESGKSNPTLKTLLTVVAALGLELQLVDASS